MNLASICGHCEAKTFLENYIVNERFGVLWPYH